MVTLVKLCTSLIDAFVGSVSPAPAVFSWIAIEIVTLFVFYASDCVALVLGVGRIHGAVCWLWIVLRTTLAFITEEVETLKVVCAWQIITFVERSWFVDCAAWPVLKAHANLLHTPVAAALIVSRAWQGVASVAGHTCITKTRLVAMNG